jgi:hypothetical protein
VINFVLILIEFARLHELARRAAALDEAREFLKIKLLHAQGWRMSPDDDDDALDLNIPE